MPQTSTVEQHRVADRAWPGDRAAPRVLLLTSTLGSGHVRAAQAIETALLSRHPAVNVQTLDFWSLMDDGVAERIKLTYLRLAQEYPELYDRIYRIDQTAWRRVLRATDMPLPDLAEALELLANASELHEALVASHAAHHALDRILARLLLVLVRQRPGWRADSATMLGAVIRWAWLSFVRRLERRVRAFRPHVAVATQMVPAALFSVAKRRRRTAVGLIGVITDFGIHDFWAQPGIDCYCVAHPAIAGVKDVNRDAARIEPTGIPLMPDYAEPPDSLDARARLGLKLRDPVVLVLGGGLGLGVESVAKRLVEHSSRLQVLVLLGRNSAGKAFLADQLDRYPERLKIWDWTDGTAVLLRAADLVVGKPGGLTVAEALACGRPLLAARSLGGQEGFNTRFLERHGVGGLVSEDALVRRVEGLLENPDELAAMQGRAWQLGRRRAAERIAELVLTVAGSATTGEMARRS